MSKQDQSYAYLARPHWERDDVKVFPNLESLVTCCDDGLTFPGPDSVLVMAVYRDGREVKVPREVYSVTDPVSKAEAEDFIRWRSDPDAPSFREVCGLFRASPDLPLLPVQGQKHGRVRFSLLGMGTRGNPNHWG